MELDELITDSTDDTNEVAAEQEEATETAASEGTDTEKTEVVEEKKDESADSSDEGDESGEKSEEDKEVDVDQSKLSGIELYLSQFDIEGGMINFEDGTSTHFTELPADKQQEVLTQLHDASSKEIEEKYGLNDDEIGLINYLRENNTTVDELVDQLAAQRAQTYIMSQQVQDMDISKMDDDAVYTAFLLRSNPEATAEQVEKDLETAKGMSNYSSIVTNLRSNFEKERQDYIKQQEASRQQELVKEIEEQRKEVVDAVSKLKEIDGLTINDGIKNDVLDMVLNVDEDGDSLFMTKVFSDPEQLFKAAFWYKNGPDVLRAREDFWRKEKSAAYKRGVEDAKKGKRTFVASDVEDKNATTTHYGEPNETISLDDLHI